MQKQLVISSDDLGMTYSVNQGILNAYNKGALTSTNFMVPCPWFEQAVQLFRNAKIDLGVHLTLVSDWANYKWRPLTNGVSLLDKEGCMYSSIEELMRHAVAEDIRNECRQQVATALQRDLPISYVDLHMCIPVIEADPITSTNRITNTDSELAIMHIVDTVANEFGLPYSYAVAGGSLKYFRSALSISGKPRDQIEAYLRSLKPGIHHLSCHCSIDSDEQRNLADANAHNYAWALGYRAIDFECITSDWFKSILQTENISLAPMPFRESKSLNNEASICK